jgi:hypothetical protein
MTEPEVVTRAALRQVHPIVVRREMPLLPERVWSDDDWKRIRRGLLARDMDDRWEAYAEGPVVYLHRSWTGHCIFEATFVPADGGWRVGHAVAEADPARHQPGGDASCCRALELVFSVVILGERLPSWPAPRRTL